MPLSQNARRRLGYALGSHGAADDLADVVDAGTGSIEAFTERRLIVAMGRTAGVAMKTAVNASSALSDFTQRRLAVAVGQGVANEIADALAAP